MEQETMIIGSDKDFVKIARKVRIRRIVIAVLLILIAALVAITLLNYKDAGNKEKPSIVFAETTDVCEGGNYTLYYSLGFKHVLYKSEYGRNYYERLMLWDDVDLDTYSLTSSQYKQMVKQINEQMNQQTDADIQFNDYFEVFTTFNASILDVRKKDNELTVYMVGYSDIFLEYDGEVYDGVGESIEDDGSHSITAYASAFDDAQFGHRMIVNATLEGDNLTVNSFDGRGGDLVTEEGGKSLYDRFPKPVARVMLTGDYVSEILAPRTINKSRLDAVAHFGNPLAEDKYLEHDFKTDKTKITEITYENMYELVF